MTDNQDPTRRFASEPAAGGRAHLLHKGISEFLSEPQITELIQTVREEFDIDAPATEEQLAANRETDRQAVRRRVCALATETDWDDPLWFLDLIFDPDGLAESFIEGIDEAARTRRVSCPNASQVRGDLIRQDRFIKALIETLRNWYLDTDFPDILVDLIVDIISDRVIAGDYLPPELPPRWFAYNIHDIPTPVGPILLAYVGPAANIDQVTDDLREEYRRLYVSGDRDRPPRYPDRDQWIIDRYLGAMEQRDATDKWAISHVLAAYEASAYRHHLDRYDLDTPDGEEAAKAHIRDVIRRERERARQLLDQLGIDDGDTPDGG